MNEWKDFFVAVAGASAALTGLIFVSVSINLTRILSLPGLPSRALLSLMLLMAMLIVSCMLLVPMQPLNCKGLEILITGIAIWIMAMYIDIRILSITEKQFRSRYFAMMALSLLSTLPYIISGIVIFCCGEPGFYFIVPAIIFSFIKSLLDAWVLLVEINR